MGARWLRPWRRIATLEREIAKRDQALRTVRHHTRAIELKAASFGFDRILEPRLSEIEMHALDARLVADQFQVTESAACLCCVCGTVSLESG